MYEYRFICSEAIKDDSHKRTCVDRHDDTINLALLVLYIAKVTLRALCVSESTCCRTAHGSAHLNMQSRNHTRRRSLWSPRFASFALLYPIPCAFHHQFYLYHYFFPFLFTSSSSESSNRKQNLYRLPSHCIKQEFLTYLLYTTWTPLRVW